jgi:SGNH domain (fused to AT3 domains)
MPTFNVAAQGTAGCHDFDAQMQAFLGDHKPDLAILSADWLEYARHPSFAGMIDDLRIVIASLTAAGTHVVLLGPSVQFKHRLPSMLLRAHLRGVVPKADDVVLPDIFALDAMMRQALPAGDGFSYVSVLDAVCPERQCPVTTDNGTPLSWDHAHLTAEGSVYVMQRLVPKLGLAKP